jgi:hypothetical protein
MSSDVKSKNTETTDESLEGKSSEVREEKTSKIREENEKTGFDQKNANMEIEPAASSTNVSATVSNKNKQLKAQPKQHDSAKFNPSRLSSVVSVFLLFTSDDISAAGELLKLTCFFIILPIKEYNTTNRPKTPNTTRINTALK